MNSLVKALTAILTVALLFLAIDFGSQALEAQASYIRNRQVVFCVLSLVLATSILLLYRWLAVRSR